MAVFSYLSLAFCYGLISATIFRSPNQVFAMTDLIGWMGFFIFLAIIGGSGILAIVTAYFMRGVFQLLYVTGSLATLAAIAFFPLSFVFNANVDFNPKISDARTLEGQWMDENHSMKLLSDRTYVLTWHYYKDFPDSGIKVYEGTWSLSRNEIRLTNFPPDRPGPWDVRYSQGYYFITYDIPDNPDAWSGNLGLMREDDWLAVQ